MGRVSCKDLQERGVPLAGSLPKGKQLKTTPELYPKSKDGRISAVYALLELSTN